MILAFAEQRDGKLKQIAFEALCGAHHLAVQLGTDTGAVIVGHNIAGLAGEISRFGVSKIFLIDDPELANYTPEGYCRVLAELVLREQPQALVLGATSTGRDLGPRLSARLKAGLLQDCVQVDVEDGQIVATRPIFAGKALARVTCENSPLVIATLRPRAVTVCYQDDAVPQVITTDLKPGLIRARVMEVIGQAAGKVELTEANVVVAGGRGMKGPEGFKILEDLAAFLGGAVGASRAAVDAGWRDHQDQVGQTGKTVAPALYIACGISGAIQHQVGMVGARCIVAINKDKDANIFKFADYGIVGDLFEIVPLLTEEFRRIG